MVNLPPEQNAPDQNDRRREQVLEFDELLAIVLALVGIGSILWWGLTRTSGFLAESGALQRRSSDLTTRQDQGAIAPADEFQRRIFEREEPRTGDRPRDTPGLPGLVPSPDAPPAPRAVTPRVAPVPVAPTTALPDTGTVQDTTQPLTIADVPTTHWAYPFIQPMFDGGYLPDLPESGFQPDQTLTRAELAALLSQAFASAPREGSARSFSDVPSNYWAARAIDNAVAQGFMSGYAEGDFRPDQAVPRYEVLVSLSAGLGLTPSNAPDQTLQSFVDTDPLPAWARPPVAAATENGLIVNYPARDRLQPAQAATRAEIVAMIHQALVQRGELPEVPSEYAVP